MWKITLAMAPAARLEVSEWAKAAPQSVLVGPAPESLADRRVEPADPIT